jgi:general secretion pathway protein I
MRRVGRSFSGRAKFPLSREPMGMFLPASVSAGASPSRTGMTLLEVVIALALFFAAMAAISEILHMGSQTAVKAQLRAEASLLGESKLNEVIAGIVPLTPVSEQAFEDALQWTWTLTVEDDTDVSIKRLLLTVNHLNTAGKSDHEIQFARLLRDPAIFQSSGNSETALESLNSVLPP